MKRAVLAFMLLSFLSAGAVAYADTTVGTANDGNCYPYHVQRQRY